MLTEQYNKAECSKGSVYDQIPGRKGWPLIGTLPAALYDLPNLIRDQYDRYGPVSRLSLGTIDTVVLLDNRMAQTLLMDREQRFSCELGYEPLLPLFGRGLLQYDFDEHRMQRRIFQTAFKTPMLREYCELVSREFVAGMKAWQWQDKLAFYPSIKQLLLQSTLSVFYGVQEDEKTMQNLADAFTDCANGVIRIFDVDLPGFRYHKAMKGRRYLREYISALIPERRVGEGKDMLSHICKETKENGEYFTDEEILDHATFLLFAAHDTTTSLLTHMIYNLAEHPAWQTRLREEIGDRDIFDFSYDELLNFESLQMVIDESLRLNPSVTTIIRRTLETVTLDGVTIPPNTYVMLIPGFNHNDPEDWLNPKAFDPMRFSAQRKEHKGCPYQFIPFGGGAHKCIGMNFARMQASLFLCHFLKNFEFSTPKGYEGKFQYVPMPKLRGDLPINLKIIQA